MGNLGQRMHPGVRPSASYDLHRLPQDSREDPFQRSLDRRCSGTPCCMSLVVCCLNLPSSVARPVICDRELECAHLEDRYKLQVTGDK